MLWKGKVEKMIADRATGESRTGVVKNISDDVALQFIADSLIEIYNVCNNLFSNNPGEMYSDLHMRSLV
jgi:hypothetical protein